jgi:hypothetical protein
MILAGIDEAGYGPLLGPLVVSAAAFRLPGPMSEDADALPCLWQLLKAAVAKKHPARKGRLLIADSKVVHNLTDGDKLIERGVLAFMRTLPTPAILTPPVTENSGTQFSVLSTQHSLTAHALMELFACTNHELASHPWYAPHTLALPWLADPGDLAITTNMLQSALTRAQVETLSIRTAVVSERLYNRLVGNTQNKASALVSITLTHLYHLHRAYGHHGLIVGVDKQGGRDHYTRLLLQTFPDAQLKVLLESESASSYLLQESCAEGTRRTLVHFREKGESHFLPTALASMVCKYLRELCMHNFNNWWCTQITGLKPTAGYHQDGSRWLLDVEPHLTRLGISRDTLVRCR